MITCEHLYKTYPEQLGEKAKQALKGISFSLTEGQTLGLVGANGAGKSTCIRILMDFMRPTTGSVRILGQSPKHPELRQHIGYLPEIASFPPSLSCMDLLEFAGKTSGMDKKDIDHRSQELLQRLKLYDERKRLLRTFSKGMQQRASFAMALIHNPKLLILDEPMSGLDPLGRAEIVNLIQELKQEGKSILFCSHLLNDVERIADDILILHHGEVLRHGSIQNLVTEANTSLEEVFLQTLRDFEHGAATC